MSVKAPCGVKTGVSWIMDRVLHADTPPQKIIGADLTGFCTALRSLEPPLRFFAKGVPNRSAGMPPRLCEVQRRENGPGL
jgi:hypothetical protein